MDNVILPWIYSCNLKRNLQYIVLYQREVNNFSTNYKNMFNTDSKQVYLLVACNCCYWLVGSCAVACSYGLARVRDRIPSAIPSCFVGAVGAVRSYCSSSGRASCSYLPFAVVVAVVEPVEWVLTKSGEKAKYFGGSIRCTVADNFHSFHTCLHFHQHPTNKNQHDFIFYIKQI